MLEYDGTTGAFITTFVTQGSGGLDEPLGLVFGPNGNLFVSSYYTNSVLEYNGTTGAFLETFASGVSGPVGLVFGPNGDLFVSGNGASDNAILEYNGATGAFVKTFASGGGLDGPSFLTFGPPSATPEPSGLLLAVLGALTGLATAAPRRAAAWFRPAKP